LKTFKKRYEIQEEYIAASILDPGFVNLTMLKDVIDEKGLSMSGVLLRMAVRYKSIEMANTQQAVSSQSDGSNVNGNGNNNTNNINANASVSTAGTSNLSLAMAPLLANNSTPNPNSQIQTQAQPQVKY
jgi:hypothetical protein